MDGSGQGHGREVRRVCRQARQRIHVLAERPVSLRHETVALQEWARRHRARLRQLLPQVWHPARHLRPHGLQRLPRGGQSRIGQSREGRGPGETGPLREDLRGHADRVVGQLRRVVRDMVRRRRSRPGQGRPRHAAHPAQAPTQGDRFSGAGGLDPMDRQRRRRGALSLLGHGARCSGL